MDIIGQIRSRFARVAVSESLLTEWRVLAERYSNEYAAAFLAFSPYAWWEAPASVLFSGFAGLGFLPDNVFSYYLPGCMLQSLDTMERADAFDTTLFRLAYPSYRLQGLAPQQVVALGWFLSELFRTSQATDTGSLNISIEKVVGCLRSVGQTDEIAAVLKRISK